MEEPDAATLLVTRVMEVIAEAATAGERVIAMASRAGLTDTTLEPASERDLVFEGLLRCSDYLATRSRSMAPTPASSMTPVPISIGRRARPERSASPRGPQPSR